jgi:hypothetical protein
LRLLIDESIPEQILPYVAEFEPSIVRRERLKGLRNGFLLRAAVDRGFTVIFSADQSLRFQQNLGKIGIGAVVIVNIRNRMKDILPVLPKIKNAIASVAAGEVIEVLPTEHFALAYGRGVDPRSRRLAPMRIRSASNFVRCSAVRIVSISLLVASISWCTCGRTPLMAASIFAR